jgi:hypothetical protein
MAQYMTYDTTVDSDIWYFEGVFKMPYGAIRGGQDFFCSFNAPKAVISGPAQAGKAIFAQAAIFWGFCRSME